MKRSLLAGALLTALLLGACGTREPVTLTETDCPDCRRSGGFLHHAAAECCKAADEKRLFCRHIPCCWPSAWPQTARGSGARTLEEMEYALGAKTDDLNHWLAACRLAEDGKVVLGQFPLDAAGAGGPGRSLQEDDPETV